VRKLILIAVAGLMVAAAAAAAPTRAPGKLIVAMHDPGCHWFYIAGGPDHRKFVKSVTRRGPVALVNLDEAALVIKGSSGTKREKVGATLVLRARGLYRITMVKQAPDDNHLRLTIR
jgi:hypothetical protein